jgi:hypothetical protein
MSTSSEDVPLLVFYSHSFLGCILDVFELHPNRWTESWV